MSPQKTLRAMFNELLAEVERNDQLRARLSDIMGGPKESPATPAKKASRRQPGRFDPMALHRQNPGELPRRLSELNLEELRDIVAENGMDRTKLAMKWKARERLIDLITSTVESRAQKGDAFRAPSSPEAQ